MQNLKVGDIVVRKSYGSDVFFTIVKAANLERGQQVYVLRGVTVRIEADSLEDDLVKQSPRAAFLEMKRHIADSKRNVYKINNSRGFSFFNRFRSRPGRILHIDSSREFLNICLDHYKGVNLQPIGIRYAEDEQPGVVMQLLKKYRPDILVLTGHDAIKKEALKPDIIDNYRNSKFFVQSVKEARRYEADYDRLSIFAGACQSYYEEIMKAGANFASSPGRVFINALDPAFVGEKIALTDTKKFVTAKQISDITISGADGIGGINTRGHLLN